MNDKREDDPMFQLDCRWTRSILVSASLALTSVHSFGADAQPSAVTPELQDKAISVLRTAMREGKAFERVHAAEALIWSGHPEGIKEYFLEQDRIAGSVALYRIGIWRTLYRLNADHPVRQRQYLERIVAVFSDPKAQDQNTAIETLSKLKYAGADHIKMVLALAEHGKDDLRVGARWILANSGKAEDEARLAECLHWKDTRDRLYAAYALRHLQTLRPATLKMVADLAAVEPADGKVRHYVLGTLYTHLPPDQRESAKWELLRYTATGNTNQRNEACMALANWPTEDMIPVVKKLLDNKPVDERVGAAYVLLRMGRPRDKVDPNH